VNGESEKTSRVTADPAREDLELLLNHIRRFGKSGTLTRDHVIG
jgi:hypothetical protein